MELPIINSMIGYIGPGAGMGMLVSLLGLVAAIGTALFTVAAWPIRNYLKKRRSRQQAG